MTTIDGVEVYPIVALGIFATVFVYYTLWAIKVNKNYVTELEEMPLDNKDI